MVLACLAVMFGPIYWEASNGLWTREEHAHAPIVLAVVLWLCWQNKDLLANLIGKQAEPLIGWMFVGAGVTLFLIGRALDFSILAFASQPLVWAGALLLVAGWPAIRLLWFPLLFLMFMIPLPGVFVDAATGALKQWVSVIAEHLLSLAGYPVGRTGVMLVVGQYQLMVADACSGLHSMFTLAAMGMLFMYIKARQSVMHNLVMLLAIFPIAFVANIVRVLVLVLVTYHLGDEAGKGFLHSAAGVVLIVAALLTLIALDGVLSLLLSKKLSRAQAA